MSTFELIGLIFAILFAVTVVTIAVVCERSNELKIEKYYNLYLDYTDEQLMIQQQIHDIKDQLNAKLAIDRIISDRRHQILLDKKNEKLQELTDRLNELL